MAEQNAKITEKQLKEIQEHSAKVNQILQNIGFVEVQKSALKVDFSKANEEMDKIKKELEKEYGSINIDLATGEYTIVEQKQEEVKSE